FVTLACLACALVTHARDAPAPSSTAAADKPRGLWFWSKPSSADGSVAILGRPEREAEALATFERWHVRRLYGSYAALITEAPAVVAAWNARLHAAGIRTEALFSDGSFLAPANREKFLTATADRILAFNAACRTGAERFDGVALDLEPHAQPGWKSATPAAKRALLEDYLSACTALRARLDARGSRDLAISAALAYWLDRLPPEGSIAWASPADRDDWFARLGRPVASISLMAYERPRPAAIIDAAAWEQKNFPGRTIIALRARLGVEWSALSDLTRILPEVEAAQTTGIDLENYELLRLAERAAPK
ncbi:MAG: hypothetical protein NTV51_14380, partial [Verrucomicrobia bacterium]|nr:hypothetical protein [Verrucomicrobiota bacterium]